MCKRNYYKEILNLMERTGYYRSTFEKCFSLCQQYYWKYSIRNNMLQAEGILKGYFEEDNYLARQRGKKKKRTRENLLLEEKLYLEFLWEIGDKYYPDKNIIDVISGDKGINIISDCFSECPRDYLKNITTIFNQAEGNNANFNYVLERHDHSSIHRAMDSVKNALNTPAPSIADSVEKVIVPEQLETIRSSLEANNILFALFTVAPITRALYNGAYRTYIYDNNDNRTVYFNLICEYNLVQLDKRIQDTKDLLFIYEETMTELNNYRSKLKQL